MITTTKTPTPYSGDAEYLDHEIATLHARCRRIVAERELREAQQPDGHRDTEEVQQAAIVARQRETETKAMLDGRIAVHREEGTFTLGLDKLANEADLGEAERLVLLCCADSRFKRPIWPRPQVLTPRS